MNTHRSDPIQSNPTWTHSISIDESLFLCIIRSTRICARASHFYCKRPSIKTHINIDMCCAWVLCAQFTSVWPYDSIKPKAKSNKWNKNKIRDHHCKLLPSKWHIRVHRCTIAIPLGDRCINVCTVTSQMAVLVYVIKRETQSIHTQRHQCTTEEGKRESEKDRQLSIVIVWWCAGDLARFLWDFAVLYLHIHDTVCSENGTQWCIYVCVLNCVNRHVCLFGCDIPIGKIVIGIAAIEHTMFLPSNVKCCSRKSFPHTETDTMDNGNKQA